METNSTLKVELHGSEKHHLERFIRFLKTDNVDGMTAGGAIYNMAAGELMKHYVKWLEAGEPEEGIGTQAG